MSARSASAAAPVVGPSDGDDDVKHADPDNMIRKVHIDPRAMRTDEFLKQLVEMNTTFLKDEQDKRHARTHDITFGTVQGMAYVLLQSVEDAHSRKPFCAHPLQYTKNLADAKAYHKTRDLPNPPLLLPISYVAKYMDKTLESTRELFEQFCAKFWSNKSAQAEEGEVTAAPLTVTASFVHVNPEMDSADAAVLADMNSGSLTMQEFAIAVGSSLGDKLVHPKQLMGMWLSLANSGNWDSTKPLPIGLKRRADELYIHADDLPDFMLFAGDIQWLRAARILFKANVEVMRSLAGYSSTTKLNAEVVNAVEILDAQKANHDKSQKTDE